MAGGIVFKVQGSWLRVEGSEFRGLDSHETPVRVYVCQQWRREGHISTDAGVSPIRSQVTVSSDLAVIVISTGLVQCAAQSHGDLRFPSPLRRGGSTFAPRKSFQNPKYRSN